jgi:hypothetical protein
MKDETVRSPVAVDMECRTDEFHDQSLVERVWWTCAKQSILLWNAEKGHSVFLVCGRFVVGSVGVSDRIY